MTSVNLTICVCRDVTRGAVKASFRFVEMEIRSNGNNTRQVGSTVLFSHANIQPPAHLRSRHS